MCGLCPGRVGTRAGRVFDLESVAASFATPEANDSFLGTRASLIRPEREFEVQLNLRRAERQAFQCIIKEHPEGVAHCTR